jgi:hypothetical protein
MGIAAGHQRRSPRRPFGADAEESSFFWVITRFLI